MAFALITGASGGIGQAIAARFAADGFSLYLHYHRNQEHINRLQNQLSRRYPQQTFVTVCADLQSVNGAWQLLQQMDQPVHYFVNNAGRSHVGLITDVHDTDIDTFTRLHLNNPFLITKKLIEPMIRHKQGRIIFVTSIWGITGASTEVMYSMVKGGQNSMVKALAKELAPSHITVNGVAPGAVDTDMLMDLSPADREVLEEDIPAGRFGQPSEIADVVRFLATDSAAYINGQILSVNGAWHC
ncbi:elongation factor P 5-aminopentanone reductase [Tuberibacillus sp. Marseille-P3662]|uniref:elongation factor P 5-aminopentanone reductase n=1 Tax=Tuberibacillus sp. Marseille-P3662 TaxID=1965358 RepID=UPI000A1CA64F|nr:SDR family oxidoreductase [Tuberibacillus sp. Marseille-P3662]